MVEDVYPANININPVSGNGIAITDIYKIVVPIGVLVILAVNGNMLVAGRKNDQISLVLE